MASVMPRKAWGALLCAAAVAAAAFVYLKRKPPDTPPPEPASASIDAVTDYDQVEDAQSQAGGFLKKAISTPLIRKDVDALSASFTPDFRARFATVKEGKRFDEEGLVVTDFAGASVPQSDAAEFLKR